MALSAAPEKQQVLHKGEGRAVVRDEAPGLLTGAHPDLKPGS